MRERPLILDRHDDNTIVDLSSDEKKDVLKASQNISLALSQLHKGVKNDALERGDCEMYCSFLESAITSMLEHLDFDTYLTRERDQRYEEIAATNQQNRELREQLGRKVSHEDCRERIKLISRTISRVCQENNLGHAFDVKYSTHGSLHFGVSGWGVLSSSFDESQFDLDREGALIANDKNRLRLKVFVMELFPSARVFKESIMGETLQTTEFIIDDLDDLAKYDDEDR